MTIGKRITMLRKQNNLTQTDLAQKIYVSPKTVSKWENDYGLPDIKIIPLLAEALQVDADYLLTGKSKIPAAFSLAQPKEKPPAPESEYDPKTYRLAIYQVTHNHLSVWLLFINVFTVILALIGLLNFINVTATSILSRRQELAMMESVGMTGAQQRRMLQGEGLCYALLSLLISCTAGVGAGYALVLAFAGQMDVFTWRFTLLPVAICTPFLIAISLAVPSVCYAYARKQSVVERLRTTE